MRFCYFFCFFPVGNPWFLTRSTWSQKRWIWTITLRCTTGSRPKKCHKCHCLCDFWMFFWRIQLLMSGPSLPPPSTIRAGRNQDVLARLKSHCEDLGVKMCQSLRSFTDWGASHNPAEVWCFLDLRQVSSPQEHSKVYQFWEELSGFNMSSILCQLPTQWCPSLGILGRCKCAVFRSSCRFPKAMS